MTERKGGYWSDFHDPSAATRRRNKKRVQQRRANREPENFGKINWRAYTHRQLWDMVKSADAAQMATRTYEWQRLAADIDQATADVQKIVQNLALSWRGPSAVAAAESVSELTKWGARSSGHAFQVGGGLDGYTSAVQEAARAIPEPVHPDAEQWFRAGYDVTTLDGPQGAYMLKQLLDDHLPDKREQQEAMDRAVRVMEQYEAASHGIGRELPVFDEAPVVTEPTGTQPAWAQPTWTPPPSDPGPVPPTWPAPPQDRQPPVDPAPSQPGVRPEGTTSAAAAGVPGPGSGYGGPGGFGSQSGFGPQSGFGSQSGFAPGGGGSFGPGVGGPGGAAGQGGFGPGGASGVLGAVPGGAAARGGVGPVVGAGGPQGFGMYPPMAPGNREDDGEHRNRYDLGLDLLDDLPPAFPPVLGE
ncbi:PPE domain-containing protein [Saccharothrix texasensis]|uniref:PPE family protein n=1 Tax=Saccharothrix texasensis TaxID=103734 RepID=A0A3N1HG07_9PSEU|nr:PPE domain-containing protein [Saccharothrix texasensis]ROP41415.1 PPE family protein [Saccharothrix texasensis]